MKKTIYNVSFRCHYDNDDYTQHRQDLTLQEIPKWIEAYLFTHPQCISISMKLWAGDAKDPTKNP